MSLLRQQDNQVYVIVAAWNEARVIARCLRSLLHQDFPRSMHIIVVANGCTDDTADVARSCMDGVLSSGHRLEVVELAETSKPAALNKGDQLAGDGIRIYIDADAELSPNAISAVTDLLQDNSPIELAAPRCEIARPRTWISRSFVRVWSALPYMRSGFFGNGFYGVSAEGRRRWDSFPTLLSEDQFVALLFEPHERCIARNASCTSHVPEGFLELVRVRGRVHRGNNELAERFPKLCIGFRGRYGRIVRAVASNPRIWLGFPSYALIQLLARLSAYAQRGVGIETWERAAR